jgi:plasmid stabilization system protein ParE
MKRRRVTIDPDALLDLGDLYRWIAHSGAPRAAAAYVRRIQKFARSLNIASERGTSLEHIAPNLRSIPFDSVVIAVLVLEHEILVVRILHASRDWVRELKQDAQARALRDKLSEP